jgi:hypothetical protein
MNVYLIPPEYVKEVYSDIEKHLERLVPTTNGRFEKIDILHDLLVGIENLWVVVEEDETVPLGIIITQVSHYPRKSMLSIQYAAGDRLDEWIDEGLQTMENWAVDNGCTGMEITGRRGWVRKLKLYDWEEEFVIVKREDLKKNNLKVIEKETTDGKEKRRKSATTGNNHRNNLSKSATAIR